MTRVFISLNETDPAYPKPELHINGFCLQLQEHELHQLAEEAHWALGHLSEARRIAWKGLATKYKAATP